MIAPIPHFRFGDIRKALRFGILEKRIADRWGELCFLGHLHLRDKVNIPDVVTLEKFQIALACRETVLS
jgi:hypothetical protein